MNTVIASTLQVFFPQINQVSVCFLFFHFQVWFFYCVLATFLLAGPESCLRVCLVEHNSILCILVFTFCHILFFTQSSLGLPFMCPYWWPAPPLCLCPSKNQKGTKWGSSHATKVSLKWRQLKFKWIMNTKGVGEARSHHLSWQKSFIFRGFTGLL